MRVFNYIDVIWSAYAVNIFFIISGFYMAMVTDTTYRNKPVIGFYISRFVRLYPAYLVSLILCIALSVWLGDSGPFSAFRDVASFQRAFIAVTNMFIFGQDLAYIICLPDSAGRCLLDSQILLNPPGWSISVELGFYLIAPFVLKSARRSILFFLLGAAYSAAVTGYVPNIPQGGPLNPNVTETTLRYYAFAASYIFFGAGACSYYYIYKPYISKTVEPNYGFITYLALLLTVALLPFAQPLLMAWWQLLLFSVTVPVLFAMTKNNAADRFIGDLSYPVYILHWPILVALRANGFTGSPLIGTIAAVIALTLGVLVLILVEKPADRWRHRKIKAMPNRREGSQAQHSKHCIPTSEPASQRV